MKVVLVTGGIGSGKSAVCSYLTSKGIGVYDCDAAVKRLYRESAGLLESMERSLGMSLRTSEGILDRKLLAAVIFNNPRALEKIEALVFPRLIEDIRQWLLSSSGSYAVIESATMAGKPLFKGLYDAVLLVQAPLELRRERVIRRDTCSPDDLQARLSKQDFTKLSADAVVENDGDFSNLQLQTDLAINNILEK